MTASKPLFPKDILVIGIGNEFARDDAAGLLVARRLKEKLVENVAVAEASGEGTSLMEAWKCAATVILVDAARSGAAPGTVFRFEAHESPLPRQPFPGSTHAFGLPEAVELARSLKELPRRLIIYGVEGRSFAAGNGVTPAVRHSVAKVADSIIREIAALRAG